MRLNTASATTLLTAVGVSVVGGIAITAGVQAADFQPYFGSLSPVLAAAGVCLSGSAALFWLQASQGFEVLRLNLKPRDRFIPMLWALPFMAAVTAADLLLGFPADINVGLPQALMFYPAMGYIAQLSLHIIPFALILPIAASIFRSWPVERRIWLAMGLAATVEAGFQVHAALSEALNLFVAMQLFLFGIVELVLYRRYDYLSMYLFRLTYYGYWHILWGYLRLL